MASLINSTATLINDAYNYYLWTLSLAGNLFIILKMNIVFLLIHNKKFIKSFSQIIIYIYIARKFF